MMLLRITFSFIKVCLLSFGGAYSAVTLIAREVVDVQKWMTYVEFADLLALDELTPGPIMINSATFVGMKIAGIPGAIAASLGCCIPPAIICFVLDLVYRKYREVPVVSQILQAMRCMSLALVISTLISLSANIMFHGAGIALANLDILSVVLAAAAFVLIRKEVADPIVVLLGCGAVSILSSLLLGI